MRSQPIHESNVLAKMFICTCILLSLYAFYETRVLNYLIKYMHILNLGSNNSQCLTLICLGRHYF